MAPEHDEVVGIYRGAGGRARSDLLVSLLAGHGIEAFSSASSAGSAYPLNVGSLGEFTIFVRGSEADRAGRLLASVLEDTPE